MKPTGELQQKARELADLAVREGWRLEYDRPVSDYWPEFRGGGKECLTVRELLGYRSGLPDNKPRLGFDRKSIPTQADWKGMLDWYALCEPEIEPGTNQRQPTERKYVK